MIKAEVTAFSSEEEASAQAQAWLQRTGAKGLQETIESHSCVCTKYTKGKAIH
jgi:hypothetical protein